MSLENVRICGAQLTRQNSKMILISGVPVQRVSAGLSISNTPSFGGRIELMMLQYCMQTFAASPAEPGDLPWWVSL